MRLRLLLEKSADVNSHTTPQQQAAHAPRDVIDDEQSIVTLSSGVYTANFLSSP